MEGCAYGRVTREMVNSEKEILQDIKTDIRSLAESSGNRLPLWTTVMITAMSSIIVGLIVYAVGK